MDFHTFKRVIIHLTELEKDALHIYVGVGIYLLSLLVLRQLVQKKHTRQLLALAITTSFAILGELLDLMHNDMVLNSYMLGASIRDLINTCLLPYVLYALSRWTHILHPTK